MSVNPVADALADAVARLEVVNPPFPVSLRAKGTRLAVEVVTIERDTGERVTLTHTFQCPTFRDSLTPLRDTELLRWIADRMRAVFVHEFHECLHVDGRRMFDAHPLAEPGATGDAHTRYDFQIGPSSPPHPRIAGRVRKP